jgi:hypothetical protein
MAIPLPGTPENDIFTLTAFGKERVVEGANEGTDTVRAAFDATLDANVENLTLISNNVMIQADFGPDDSASLARPIGTKAIVGSWFIDDADGRSVITFLPDGTYMHVQNGDADDQGGAPGVEVGSYTWNPSTHKFTTSGIVSDTNGTWGFSDGGPGNAAVSGDVLTFSFTGEADVQLGRRPDVQLHGRSGRAARARRERGESHGRQLVLLQRSGSRGQRRRPRRRHIPRRRPVHVRPGRRQHGPHG